MKNTKKYQSFPPVDLPNRQWPNRVITYAPIWCSVDLRDGNQALSQPMSVEQKLEFFQMLVKIGFKEIEVGFPLSSNTDFNFIRCLIEENLIPDDVTIQVLTLAREDSVEDTIKVLVGAKKVIIHMYNSTSPAQRRVVFKKSKEEIKALAVHGVQMIKDRLHRLEDTEVMLQYSPESFSATEMSFAKKISEAVMDVWQPTPARRMILNLPETVEVATPNVYADQIEWICGNIQNRDSLIISLHTHNDRGTGVAATELGLLAGADRVEGTLFGNGERTGNADLITLGLNMYVNGVDPDLDFSNVGELMEVYERCTSMDVPPRHPYVGELVFTAFSGGHQDAIAKGLEERKNTPEAHWDVPYLAIDPADIGRKYGEVIRVTSQSGSAAVAYLLKTTFRIDLPKDLQREFGSIIKNILCKTGGELSATDLKDMFWKEYVDRTQPWVLNSFNHEKINKDLVKCKFELLFAKEFVKFSGEGNGVLSALVHGFATVGVLGFKVLDYFAHALASGEEAMAISYVLIETADRKIYWGAGIDSSIELAPVRAVLSALNRI